MGAWQYCRQCDAGMREPSLVACLRGETVCPNGHPQAPSCPELVLEHAERDLALLRKQVDWLLALAREVGREPPEFD